MKRNGLVFVPREPPKRVILYPTQDSASQQQSNGFHTRAKTAITTTDHSETVQQQQQQQQGGTRLSRQPFSSPINSVQKPADTDATTPNFARQHTAPNLAQKIQNPYYANPFFRPKVVTSQQPSSFIGVSASSRDSTTTTTTTTLQTFVSNTTATSGTNVTGVWTLNRAKQPVVYPASPSPQLLLSGQPALSPRLVRQPDTASNNVSIPTQDDNRRWAHSVASASIARRTVSEERPVFTPKNSETTSTNATINDREYDSLGQKGASATAIVMSLMDTWRAPLGTGNSSVVNSFTRGGMFRDDTADSGQASPVGEQMPTSSPFLAGANAAAGGNNQNWKKALVANFQRNSRNIPTAKMFAAKSPSVAPQPPSNPIVSDPAAQLKNDRPTLFNGPAGERAFQAVEAASSVPFLTRKSTESLRVTRQDNSGIERSTSLQVQSTSLPNSTTTTTTTTQEEIIKPAQVPNLSIDTPLSMQVPAALITAKPPASAEQQRAIITRVMIRRDFVKSTESRPPIPTAANVRSLIPPHSAKPGGLSTSNVIQVATITESSNAAVAAAVNANQNYQQQQQQSAPLSQKSLLAFASVTMPKESKKFESTASSENTQQLNATTTVADGMISPSASKTQTQITTTNGIAFRSASLSAANAETRKKKDEINTNNKVKKRAHSASALSMDDG